MACNLVVEYRRSISPVPMPVHQETRRSTDSGIGSGRTVQSNAPIFETSRYKTPTRFDTATPYLGGRQTTSELGSGVYQAHRQTSLFQQLFAFFLLAEFYATQSGSRAKTTPLKT
jgi:hypothetical protein